MTVHCLFDPAVFYTTEEYNATFEEKLPFNIEDYIEEPELYMFCMSSSSLADQLASISDHLDCLPSLKDPIYSTEHIPIHDTLRFYTGDHPAASFERGCQLGGNYKCGSCGVRSNRIDDLAHVFSFPCRNLSDIQTLVLKGKFGNQPGVLKPLGNLKKPQLCDELWARCIPHDVLSKPKELNEILSSALCGAQRVPTILINTPTLSLSDLNLGSYCVLDCEPLHDLKGHLINMLTELPHILSGEPKKRVSDLLGHVLFSKKQNGYSGSDVRIAVIEVHKHVHFSDDIDDSVKQLLSTAVKISQCLYASCGKRTPKTILQLYNATWLHHELCKTLFSKPREITYDKLFGIYLHSLVFYAPRNMRLFHYGL